MKCRQREELLLYLTNAFHTVEEKSELEAHLQACPDCRDQAVALKHEYDAMRRENKRECDAVMLNLPAYLDGKTITTDVDMKEHLNECQACQMLQRALKKKLVYEQVLAFDYAPPQSLEQKINDLLAANQENSPLAALVDSLTNKVDELIDRIVLVLRPMPAPVFLGGAAFDAVPIETTSTRDLKVDVGAPGRTVKIFSADDVELDSQISTPDGIVVFKDFVPAKYKLQVEGFEINDLTLWP